MLFSTGAAGGAPGTRKKPVVSCSPWERMRFAGRLQRLSDDSAMIMPASTRAASTAPAIFQALNGRSPWTSPVRALIRMRKTLFRYAILGRWLRERVPTTETVDVRPCGAGEALIGMADAIGRSVRVIVVEDRDFRSADRAKNGLRQEVCRAREDRGIAMRGWVAWTRNEIENYFLDDEVLVPAMREAFECSDADTKAARDEAIKALYVFQVVQAAASDADVAWAELAKARRLGGGKPKWSAAGLEAYAGSHDTDKPRTPHQRGAGARSTRTTPTKSRCLARHSWMRLTLDCGCWRR